MDCPACLSYDVTTEAVTTVGGTTLCARHGVEALNNLGLRPLRAEQYSDPRQQAPAVSDPRVQVLDA